MAVPGVGTIYRDLNTDLREDVLSILYQVDDVSCPFFDMIGDAEAIQPFHQWEKRNLTLRSVNAVAEGDVYAFSTDTIATTRELNVTQIFKKEVRVSRTSQKSSRYAIQDKMADELMSRLTELKTDMEFHLIRGTLASGRR